MLWFFAALLSAIADATRDFVSKTAMKTVNPYVTAWALLSFTLPFLALALPFAGIPQLGALFWPAVIANAVVYMAAVVLYMKALGSSDLSLVLPMIAFTPAFMLLTGSLLLGELPSALGMTGVLAVAGGAYLLNIGDARKGILEPFAALTRVKGTRYMLAAALLFSFTAVTLKMAVTESNPVFAITVVYAITAVLFSGYMALTKRVKAGEITRNWKSLAAIGFFMAIAELGLVYAFTLTLAVYAIAVKRLSIIIGSLYGFKFFKEKHIGVRLLGSAVMIAGVLLISFG